MRHTPLLRLSLLASLATSGGLAAQVPDTVMLNPVVVTATRFPRSAAGVPAAVTVLRGVDLRAQGIHTVLEALRDVPGAAVVQTGSLAARRPYSCAAGRAT